MELYRKLEPQPVNFFKGLLWSKELCLPPDLCLNVINEMQRLPQTPQKTVNQHLQLERNEHIRKTQHIHISRSTQARITQKIMGLKPDLEQFFGRALTACQVPQFLLYRPGDFFVAHKDQLARTERKAQERQVSLVIALNPTDYTGGELVFYPPPESDLTPAVGYPVVQSAGQALAFLPDLVHEVVPVLSGLRYTIVTWFYT